MMNAPMVRVDFIGTSLGPSWFVFSELVFRVQVRVYRVASFESETALQVFVENEQNFMVNFKNSMARVLRRSLKTRTTQQRITRRIVLKLYRFRASDFIY